MDSEQARKVLGLNPDEDGKVLMPAFMDARERMAELVRKAPTAAMEARYQAGLMEFDQALAFFRELEKKQDLLEGESPQDDRHVAQQEVSEVIDQGAEAPAQVSVRHGRRVAGFVTISILLCASLIFAWREWQKNQHDAQQLKLAAWESQAADHIAKRRWEDALRLYEMIEKNAPSSPIVVVGKRSIEAGMIEEQGQFIGYWAGVAVSAFEAGRLDESAQAIAKVLQRQPGEKEMLELSKKLRLQKSASVREALMKQAQDAIDHRQWNDAIKAAEQLLQLDPTSEDAQRLKATALDGQKKELINSARAAELFEAAKKLDKGSFDKNLLALISEAKELAPENTDIAALYEKVASYGRTLRVPKDFDTVQKALAEAKPFDRIVLADGEYLGPIAVDVGVRIEAAGDGVVVSCPADQGPAMTFNAAAQAVKVSGVQFRHDSYDHDAERFAAVLVRTAAVEFANCTFRRAAGHGLAVIAGGDVIATKCRFEENGWDGLHATDAGTKVRLSDSVSRENIHHGIDIWKQASATLESNLCEENCLNGILVNTTADIGLKNNQLRGNREYGMFVREASAGTVSGNEISMNMLGGAVVAAAAKGVDFRDNSFQKNAGPALRLGKGLAESNYRRNEFKSQSADQAIEVDLPIE